MISKFYRNYQNFTNVFILIFLSLITFYNSALIGYLEVDDYNLLIHDKSSINPLKVFTTNTYGYNSSGNFRPIEVLSHKFDSFFIADKDPVFRHITNIFMHLLNVILVYALASIITKRKIIGLMAGSFFSVFIIHSYSLSSVSWISGRVDLFVTFFYLLSLFFFIKYLSTNKILFYFFSIIMFYFALMSKEMAVTFPLIIILYSILFLEEIEHGKNINSIKILRVFYLTILGGALLFAFGFLLKPMIAILFSSDHKLHTDSIHKIKFFSMIIKLGGVVILIIGTLAILILKHAKNKFKLFKIFIYAWPYVIVFIFSLFMRFYALGEVGGLYKSSDGVAVNFSLLFDSFIRDLLALAALIWPVGKEYHLSILMFQANHVTLFYVLGLILLLLIGFIFYYLIVKKHKLLLFSFAWVFVTLIPVHNIIISSWYFNQRYLYLPAIGFCIFISLLVYKFFHKVPMDLLYPRYILIGVFVLFIGINSFLIVKHNNELRKNAASINGLVQSIHKHQSVISNSTKVIFVLFPLTPVSTKSCVFVEAYLKDILSTLNHDWYYLNYSILFYSKKAKEDSIEIKWIDDNNFTVILSNPENYGIIPAHLGTSDIKLRSIYNGIPYHTLLSPLPSQGQSVQINGAIVETLLFDEKSNKSELKVKLIDHLNDKQNSIFVGHFKNQWKLAEFSSYNY